VHWTKCAINRSAVVDVLNPIRRVVRVRKNEKIGYLSAYWPQSVSFLEYFAGNHRATR
jgi:hypothetical protein